MKLAVILTFFMSIAVLENKARKLKGLPLTVCHFGCTATQFNCNCEHDEWNSMPKKCISRSHLCDGWADCADGSDEIDCHCKADQFQCGCELGGNCIANSIYECLDIDSLGRVKCLSMKNVPKTCQDQNKRCNGVLNCPWDLEHDEANCTSCPPNRPNPCRCNAAHEMSCTGSGFTCYGPKGRCDRRAECSDASDEVGCSCDADEFKCRCYDADPVTCPFHTGCIPATKVGDGIFDCPDNSDETPFENTVSCSRCNVTVWRYTTPSECNVTLSCDSDTCYGTPALECHTSDCNKTEAICTSNCASNSTKVCNRGYQCSDGSLIVSSQFCNNQVDCADGSDEVRHEPGFKCPGMAGTCVLPQRNLYDDVAHCLDHSDLCFDGTHHCYQCMDKRLVISSHQRCDGIIDCYDRSDECFCNPRRFNISVCFKVYLTSTSNRLLLATETETTFNVQGITLDSSIFAVNASFTVCQTKWGVKRAVLCDGRPECRDFSDECNCHNRPLFCDDNCHSYYPLGDRYCDGFEDEAWIYVNNSDCPKGFDERHCPKRFRCKAADAVSIDVKLVCDGIAHCDDGSDEHCSTASVALTTTGAIPTEAVVATTTSATKIKLQTATARKRSSTVRYATATASSNLTTGVTNTTLPRATRLVATITDPAAIATIATMNVSSLHPTSKQFHDKSTHVDNVFVDTTTGSTASSLRLYIPIWLCFSTLYVILL